MSEPTIELREWRKGEPCTWTVYRSSGRKAEAIGIIGWQPTRGYWRIIAHEPGNPNNCLRSWTEAGDGSYRSQAFARDQLADFIARREMLLATKALYAG